MDFPAVPSRGRAWIAGLIGFGLLAGLFGTSFTLLPSRLAYTLTADAIVVDAGIGWLDSGRTIPRADVTDAEAVRLPGGRKSMGSNRPGYCVGRWTFAELGDVWLASACGRAAVLLTTAQGSVVLEPVDRGGFLQALGEPGATGRFEAPAPPPWGASRYLPLAPLALVLALPFVLVRLLRPMAYTVADGHLVVPAHFSSVRVPLAGAVVRRGELRGRRVAGSAAPGLYLGHFKDAGGKFHAAATARTGVWVQGERRVFVSPADLDGFVAAAVAAGATVAEAAG